MNKLSCLVVLLYLFGVRSETLHAQHVVGNPGDPIRLLISEARSDARVILIRVPADSIPELPDQPRHNVARDWYSTNHAALEAALRDTRLEFPIDAIWTHCALAVRSELTIYFSYPKCQETVKSKADAIRLLLHEGTHLIGNDDEQLADDVANMIYQFWLNLDANRTPRWDSVNPNRAPLERSAHASTLFRDPSGEDKLFIWGGCNESNEVAIECSNFLKDGAIYDLKTATWLPVEAPPVALLPAGHKPIELARAWSTAVFTGTAQNAGGNKIIIYGGCSGEDYLCRSAWNSALIYDLATKQWEYLEGPPNTVGRAKHHAFWINQSRMLVWGGVTDPATAGHGRSLSDGLLLSFNRETARWQWSPLDNRDAPSARRHASAVLTDKHLIIYGGCEKQVGRYCPDYYGDGGLLDLQTLTWRSIKSPTGFTARAWHTAVWTGQQMIVWGGMNRQALRDGIIFKPGEAADGSADLWLQIAGTVDSGRWMHDATWAGDRMLVWGGQAKLGEPANGLLEYFLPSHNAPFGRWNAPISPAAPVGRWHHTSHWTRYGLLVWGGTSELRSYLNSGGIFVPFSGFP